MGVASLEVEFPRRQAMLSVYEERVPTHPWQDVTAAIDYMQNREVVDHVPVFVWSMPTRDGYSIVERRDGNCTYARPSDPIFLDSEELFDQYDWSTNEA